jgi:hypothetical protein
VWVITAAVWVLLALAHWISAGVFVAGIILIPLFCAYEQGRKGRR